MQPLSTTLQRHGFLPDRADEIERRWNAFPAMLALAERVADFSCGCLGVAPVCVRCEARAALRVARGA